MYETQKNAAQGKILVFSLQYTQGKSENFFYIFKKTAGWPSPPSGSCTPAIEKRISYKLLWKIISLPHGMKNNHQSKFHRRT